MRTYNPDGWVILKFIPEEEECFYKIFGTWRGSFLYGDSWRLSSGSTEFPTLSECGLFWIWAQYSGSGVLIERVQLDPLIMENIEHQL